MRDTGTPTEIGPGGAAGVIPPTLIAGVGYRNLRDLSAGNAVVDALLPLAWPPGVEVEDLSYGPMDVIFRLREARFARLFVVGLATGTTGDPGEVRWRRWHYEPEPPDMVQGRVAEAVTGVISLDNLLVICAHFAALPPEVTVIEIAPGDNSWGDEFSPAVARSIADVVARLREEYGIPGTSVGVPD
jgi:hydrogenase maturation protease